MANYQQVRTFKQIQVFFLALLMGQVMVGLILHFVLIEYVGHQEMDKLLKFGIPLLVLGGSLAARLVDRNMGRTAGEQSGLVEKLDHFRNRKMVVWAIQDGCNLMCLIFAFLYQYDIFMWFFVFGVISFLALKPSLDVLKEEYKLTPSEQQVVENESFTFLR